MSCFNARRNLSKPGISDKRLIWLGKFESFKSSIFRAGAYTPHARSTNRDTPIERMNYLKNLYYTYMYQWLSRLASSWKYLEAFEVFLAPRRSLPSHPTSPDRTLGSGERLHLAGDSDVAPADPNLEEVMMTHALALESENPTMPVAPALPCGLRVRFSRARSRHHHRLGAARARRPDHQRHGVVPPKPLRRRRDALPALHQLADRARPAQRPDRGDLVRGGAAACRNRRGPRLWRADGHADRVGRAPRRAVPGRPGRHHQRHATGQGNAGSRR